jgi:tellurite resistance protein
MGVFDKLFKVNETKVKELNLTKEEAFVGIILSSVAVDEVINKEELMVVSQTIGRMQAFRRFHPQQVVNMLNNFLQIIKREGVGNIVNSAKNTLNKEMRETAFALAIDIILADGVVEQKEKEFLESLQEILGLSNELATKIVEVMIIKNKGAGEDFSPEKASRFYG